MTLREKLELRLAAIRRVDAKFPCPGDAFDHALIEVALAAIPLNSYVEDAALSAAIERLDAANP
jgi:hypothetical protein